MTHNQNTNVHDETGWNFDNSYRRLPDAFFAEVEPIPVPHPEDVTFNRTLAESLGLNPDKLAGMEGAATFAGNYLPLGAEPIAQAYAGHQFGNFTMLGDGRAVLLGEQITPDGRRVDIQLKGSGRTPFSRGGDGRAALGPMIREHIISEAMHALNIPTSRSLSVVTTGEGVQREIEFPGAVLTRVASSHLRFGTFQYAAKWGGYDNLKALANYAIERHYPEAADEDNPYLALLEKVIKTQADTVAKWQLTGFIHGVMNTDNMTLSGETIDYGPCAFMNTYDPATVFSSIDVQGRYAYGNQPYITGWNLARFAETLIPLINDDQEKAVELLQEKMKLFSERYQQNWLDGMRAKLGLFDTEEGDEALVEELLTAMEKTHVDFTNTFRALTYGTFLETSCGRELNDWHDKWQSRLKREGRSEEDVRRRMETANPAVIPRNHRVEEALEAAVSKSDYTVMEKLLDALSDPYDHTKEYGSYTEPPESEQGYQTFCGT
ncbi:protein adenylyltransferase SelO [Alteribacter natronophilus]|uniref:protein adenylyltransferase SelO n=1 Tax=Alteribacter natronophilus TaxID=2583810 RepID=UPI00110E6EEB|nr:YdiU family protein [Alteribacter natronophilus]TMW71252.1 YdiU family protein [Alteribacter natronophilus]